MFTPPDIEFVSPYPLEEAVARLKALYTPLKEGYMQYPNRVGLTLHPIDASTVDFGIGAFTLYSVHQPIVTELKTNAERNRYHLKIEGTLQRLETNETLIKGYFRN